MLKKLIDYLHETVDDNCKLKSFNEKASLPLFLRELYEFQIITILESDCLLLLLHSKNVEILKIQKHFAVLQRYTVAHPVLILSATRAAQRKKLLQNRIPFIVPGTQLYLPFISMDFRERYPIADEKEKQFTTTTQAVYLYLFYRQLQLWSATDIAKEINTSIVTVCRALRHLNAIGLVKKSGTATKVKYQRINKRDYYAKAQDFLTTPVAKTFYLDKKHLTQSAFIAGEEAYAEKTMLNYPKIKTYAIGKTTYSSIPKEQQHVDAFLDKDIVRIEVWKYDPGLFAVNKRVDDLSLLLSLKEYQDDRMAIENEPLLGGLLCED